MSFPWVYSSNFSTSATPFGWDSEADTDGVLDVAHYTELARFPWPTCAPYRGAYCLRAALAGGTNDAYVLEGDINIATSANNFFRFYVWLSPDFTATADDTVNLFEAQQTSNAAEVTFGLRVVAATEVINFGIGETAPTSWGTPAIERGVWYCIEIDATIDTGGNDGTIDLYVTKEGDRPATSVFATQVASLTQGAVTHGVLGPQGHLATTTGTILFDEFVHDDARIYPIESRYGEYLLMSESGHAFVGPGTIDNISLLSGAGTDNVVSVYDTDESDTNDASNIVTELKNTANNELVDPAGMPVDLKRGAYVNLSGTNPRALLKLKNVIAFSTAMVRNIGIR